MATPRVSPIAAVLGAVAVCGLLAADAVPSLRSAPLLLLALAAAAQIDRELAHAFSLRRLHPSAPVMNLQSGIILIHMAYFRADGRSNALELLGTFFVAMWILVVVAAFASELKLRGLVRCLRDYGLSLACCLVVAGGLSCAMFVQVQPGPWPSAQGSLLAALILAAAWLAAGIESLFAVPAPRAAEAEPSARPPRIRPAGEIAGVLVATVALAAGAAVAKLPHLTVGAAAGLGLLVGLAGLVGRRAVRALAGWCGQASFRHLLPDQMHALQGIYERAFAVGLTEQVAWLALVFPAALAYLRWAAA